MGKRGPKPTPSATRKLRGTYRADRRRGEPVAAAGARVPAWLDDRSRKYWHQISPLLEDAGVLTVLDQVALGLLCKAITDYLLACEIVEAEAGQVKEDDRGNLMPAMRFVTVTDKGNLIQHPGVGVMNRAWERVVKLLREFGMTPSARASIHVDGAEPEDQLLSMIREHYAAPKK